MGLAQRAIIHEVIAITNCFRTVGGQGLLLSYPDVAHPPGDREAFPTVDIKCLATNPYYKDSFLQLALEKGRPSLGARCAASCGGLTNARPTSNGSNIQ